jgi:hypothetical protein
MAYTPAYENSLHFSPYFQSYARTLAIHLIDRYDLHSKDIIEIGCGKGEFLALLCTLGDNRGVGFDPSYVPDKTGVETNQITFIRDFYSERYADYRADFIGCRHVLEHVQSPRAFMMSVRNSIGDQSSTVVFFEVPNALFTFRDHGIWDLIYEHCSYFCASSLAYLFMACGFEVDYLSEAYAGQFLCIEAVPVKFDGTVQGCPKLCKEMARYVAGFEEQHQRKIATWQEKLIQIGRSGQRAVVWGAGSKGVTFLNMVNAHSLIEYVVDINPRKHGMHLAGTGQQIVPPDFLRKYQPALIILMNAIYKDEVCGLITKMGLTSEIVTA